MTDLPNSKIIEETDYIHTYFGLSYSAYQVLPRTLMQSMPAEWQKRMVACLEELRAAFRHIEHADVYEVTAAVECYYDDLSEADMKALGITRPDAPDGDDEDADLPNVYYDRDGVEHESDERVLVPRPGGDPIPHYNRGRTHIEPLPLPVADGREVEHERLVCRHGWVVAQCKCIGPHVERVVDYCPSSCGGEEKTDGDL